MRYQLSAKPSGPDETGIYRIKAQGNAQFGTSSRSIFLALTMYKVTVALLATLAVAAALHIPNVRTGATDNVHISK